VTTSLLPHPPVLRFGTGPAPSRRVALAERAVPRYTSYPTAPHFHAGVDAETYGARLAALPSRATLSLYLHVPFCAEMCWYCGCHTKIARRPEPVDAYRAALGREVGIVAGLTPARRVQRIHWGGGTPSQLRGAGLAAVVEEIARRFDLSDLDEHAIELDPRHVDRALADDLARLGVTRVSLGVQDLSPHVQAAIGRVQPFAQVAETLQHIRAAGIGAASLDLMYGLPRQTVGDVERSTRLAASLRPDRVSAFGYAHVPWMKSHQRLIADETLPDIETRLEQAEMIRDVLMAEGYVALGLDHFARWDDPLAVAARAGRLARNFQGYTDDRADALLGLGASAIGRTVAGYVQNAPDIGGYRRAVESGRPATVRGYTLDADDRLRAAIIEQVMCAGEVDVAAVARDHGLPPDSLDGDLAGLDDLEAVGIVVRRGRQLEVTPAGALLVRLVAAAFDAHGKAATARHAPAV
jgi:oxygen-independent coproporphyrinogen-3 oxidase